MADQHEDFRQRYGSWAVVAGASDGVGEASARAFAARGLNVVLVARRGPLLADLAIDLRQTYGIDARAAVVDLSSPEAAIDVIEATHGLDVGMLVYCAGADPNYAGFLDHPVETATSMVHRNCIVPVQLIHHYAAEMVGRKRGGIVVLSSGAMLVGAPNMVAYAATKAFDTVMTEALWTELHPHGVDVLGLVLGATDTPAFRQLMLQRGLISSLDQVPAVPGLSSIDAVTERLLANLGNGPTVFADDLLAAGAQYFGAMPRNEAVRTMMQHAAATMGPTD